MVLTSLTNGDDVFSSTLPNRCILARDGRDTVFSAVTGPSAVIGGPGSDIIMAGGPGAQVRAGAGDDTVNVWGGLAIVTGDDGNDTITVSGGQNLILPGAGIDNISASGGNNTFEIDDLCEVGAGEQLIGGDGFNTLITPVPAADLVARGVVLSGFTNVVVQHNSCKSSCVQQPDCSGHGHCAEGSAVGQVVCACDAAFTGQHCEFPVPTPKVTCVTQDDATHFTAIFGYQNTAPGNVEVPVGSTNKVSPGPQDRHQPHTFFPGDHDATFFVPFEGSVQWTLGAGVATATSSSPPCPVFPNPFDEFEPEDPLKSMQPAPTDLPALNGLPLTRGSGAVNPGDITPPATDNEASPGASPFIRHGRNARAVEVVLANRSPVALSFLDGTASGEWVTGVPGTIASATYAAWETQNKKALHGTEGHIDYAVPGGAGLDLHWDDPFIGSNSYDATPPPGFAVDIIGGEHNHATVFYHLRSNSQAPVSCPREVAQWIIDSMRAPEDALSVFPDKSAAAFLTPLKETTGFTAWGSTGCQVVDAAGTIAQIAWSTDGFFTIDVLVDQFFGTVLTGTEKAVRLEVKPETPANIDLLLRLASSGGVSLGDIHVGTRIIFSGTVFIDHGAFLEVHPVLPLHVAPPCSSFQGTFPNDPALVYCTCVTNADGTRSCSETVEACPYKLVCLDDPAHTRVAIQSSVTDYADMTQFGFDIHVAYNQANCIKAVGDMSLNPSGPHDLGPVGAIVGDSAIYEVLVDRPPTDTIVDTGTGMTTTVTCGAVNVSATLIGLPAMCGCKAILP
jgi:Ca2+-binding RTX toxin-like protein